MADGGWSTDNGEAVYRSRDAIKNLKIRVRVQRVTSTAVLSQHLQHQVLTQQERGVIELDTFNSQLRSGPDDDEVLAVGWQEKLFSQYEEDLYQSETGCQTPLEKQYHTEILALQRGKGRRNRRIFTYTDFDRFTNWEEHSQNPIIQAKFAPTFLAERMANIRHRKQERRTVDASVAKARVITWEPSEEFVKNSHVINTTVQTMHIMGDLGPSGKLGLKENEYVLCTIRADSNGVITIKPDFNNSKGPYRVETEGEKKEVWRLTLVNAAPGISVEEKDRELRMYKDLYVRHRDYLNSLVGPDFEMPPIGVLRLLINGEIVSAKGFEYDNLYIHFVLDLPNNWFGLPFEALSGVTQTCQTRTLGKDNVAFFSYPFSFETFFRKDDESEESLPQWPVLYFKVLSLDYWQRYRTEGYGYLVIPSVPGNHSVTCETWRPVQNGTVAELRRFFIGGSPELEDNSYVRIPSTFKGERLSRFGFRTETSGSVTFTLYCLQQARAFVDANTLRRRRQTVEDQLGGYSQRKSVQQIMDLFEGARGRMRAAREAFPDNAVSVITTQSSESTA
ncbi:Meckel syndrome type 1 protein [Clupea harengus]|uniref:Meckel syndrome type 1 protein n=1 Tax=Clupea harengus TaxID=7950 RepID=A0A6P8FY50_CLUHA|nr:Meckel syndrome type 1 protein [Clupea harengus]